MTQRFPAEIRQLVQSPGKAGEAIGSQNQLKVKTRTGQWEVFLFETVMRLRQGFVHVPKGVMIETRV
jgi:hypothetical protein